MRKGWVLAIALLASAWARGGDGELAIYTDEWPPLSYAEGSEVKGMAVELVDMIRSRLHVSAPVKLVPWARAYSYVLNRPNVMLFVLGRSAEREALMTMVGPVARADINLYCRRGEASRLKAMGEKMLDAPLTAFRSSIFLSVARKHGFRNIVESATPEQSALLLHSDRVTLWSEGDSVVASVMDKAGLDRNEIELLAPLEKVDLYLAFSKGTPRATIAAWEGVLRDLKHDGSYRKLYQRWLPSASPPLKVERVGLEPVDAQ
ncbi:ABC transporter substrate-binding protein [Chromobacterium sp. IIBBL 290-4]|uniref:substrate-binding periplasmic protein n=1 Tax=Chromobacterium sp. IIBBL 290-4 TaxID=2953890 RepID=UPI0020B6D0FC|nr:transporter substrate-binding domain-containing protein [Chromobacterium sp. IIBBL 290-4]UTH73678.1 transporter substrate-binding domain-containing protein [Chromobacterium sp. IIBBL 290-4]